MAHQEISGLTMGAPLWKLSGIGLELAGGGALLALCIMVSCVMPVSDSPLIARYAAAVCIQPTTDSANERSWEGDLVLPTGARVIVRAAQMPGGRVEVSYPGGAAPTIAVSPGDYIYPADLRVDLSSGLLYVKARGLAAGISKETWLFEYDLRSQKLVDRVRVKADALPPECQAVLGGR